MSDKVFLDTNILVYTLGHDDRRTPAAEALLEEGGVISVQVLNELAAVARRKLKMPWEDVIVALGVVRTLCPTVVPTTAQLHDAALALASRHDFQIFDALIVAAALDAGCRTLYSEDMQSGQVISGRLTIRNPFAAT